ncbi:RDD family protein [Campylobacter sp.]|uniref:RDD family protein n=1 Tax=Campylobacter sp. TaxID=205 RepID=UPI00270A6B76|nr:RDD family protein [Campylobacter sp.]
MSQNILDRLDREGIRLASLRKRAFAYMIDEILISTLLMIIYWDKFAAANTYEEIQSILIALVYQIIILKFVYQTFFTWYYGASIGKILMKIVCVNVELLDKPNLSSSFIRSFVRIMSENLLFLGFAWALGNQTFQTWHDLAAKTVVIDVY